MKCIYCTRATEMTDGKRLYPHLPGLANKPFHACFFCDAWVGCHPGSTRALGDVANAEARRSRSRAHAAFDPIWKSKEMSRSAAYKWLAASLGIEPSQCHIGTFDTASCNRVVDLCATREFA